MIRLPHIFIFLASCITTQAQLSTNSNVSPTTMVQNTLLGTGVNAFNINFIGDFNSIGTFDGSNCNVGISSGVIMTTGTVNNSTAMFGTQEGPFGPNDVSNAGVDNGFGGDALLEQYAGTGTSSFNASVLEFDFEATGNVVSFNYVFGSEEYPEYVNAGFNDVFGFFISGPNPAGGNYINKNIALIPGTNIPVAIDNVHAGSYSQYFNNNGDGNSGSQMTDPTVIQYDGFTDVLNALANVECGQTYHIKIAICDIGDGIYDSGVFLEANSFTSPSPMQMSSQVFSSGSLGANQMLEGCSNADITFTRGDSLNYNQTFALTYSGSASNGVDYSSMPSTVSFGPGQTAAVLSLNSIYDQISEGTESLTITVAYNGLCGQILSESKTIDIVDQVTMQMQLTNDTVLMCNAGAIDLHAQISGGTAPYSFAWDHGPTSATINVNPNVTTSYNVTVTDACGHQSLQGSVEVTVFIPDPLTVDLGNDISLFCPNAPAILNAMPSGGSGALTYLWSTGSTASSIDVQTMTTQVYSVTVIDQCGNTATDDIVVEIQLDPLSIEMYGDTLVCPGDAAQVGVIAINGAGNYVYEWETGETSDEIFIYPSSSMWVTVNVYDDCATYMVSDSFYVEVSAPVAAFEVQKEDRLVVDANVTFTNSSQGAVAWYWDLGNGVTSTSFHAETEYEEEGDYVVMLIAYNDRGCSDTTFKTITVNPPFHFYVPNAFTPDGDGLNDVFVGEGVGVMIYELRIFDRWGHLIYTTTDPKASWDGTLGGSPAQLGVYVWQYQLQGYDNTYFYRTGHVTLIR